MLFSTLTTVLFSSVALAAPAALEARAENCAPTTYTLSEFSAAFFDNFAAVDFNFKSSFAEVNGIDDPVTGGSDCRAEGASIPNSNECNAPGRKLLFDLRGPQQTAHYQITHTWVCNGATWMSGNDVTVQGVTCDGPHCRAPTQTFAPQNVRKICNSPRC